MAGTDNREDPGVMLELAQVMLDECDTAAAAWKPTGEVLLHNRAFTDLMGMAGADLSRRRLQDLLGEAQAAKLLPSTGVPWAEVGVETDIVPLTDAGYDLRVRARTVSKSPDSRFVLGVFVSVAWPGLDRVREAVDSAVFALDRRGRVIHWNQGAESLYGVSSPEVLGRALDEVLPGHPLVEASAGQPEPSERSLTLLERPGFPPLLVSRYAVPMLGLDGAAGGYLDVATNAGDPRPLRQTIEYLEDAVARSQDMILTVDRRYRIVQANPAYLNSQRKEREEVIGRRVAEVLGEEVFASTLKPRLEECFRGEDTHFEMYRYYEHLGRRHLLVSYYPVHGAFGEVVGATAVARDTTPQHTLAQQRDAAVRLLDVISGSGSVEELATRVLDVLADLTECEILGMRLRRGGNYRHPAVASVHRQAPSHPGEATPTESLPQWEIAARNAETELFRQQSMADGYRTLALLPLSGGRDQLGVIYLADARPGLLGQDMIRFLEELAVSMAVGLERLNAEADLRASEERYRTFVSEFSGIAYRGDMDFVPEFFHGAVEKITGYAETDFLDGSPRWDQVIHPDDLADITASASMLTAAPGSSAERTYRIVRRDGAVRWVHEYITSVRDPYGERANRVQGTIYDVTETVEADRRISRLAADLAQERDVLRTLMENTQAQLAFLDRDLRFVLVNSAYEAGCGHSLAELVGRDHFELFPNDENQTIFERVRDTGEPAGFKAKPFVFTDDSDRGITYWDWTLTAVKDEKGGVTGLVLSLVDVTESVEAQYRMKDLAQKAHRHAVELEATVQAIADGMIVYGPTGSIVNINEAARNILGYSPEQYGRPLVERVGDMDPTDTDGRLLSPDDIAPVRALRGETVLSQSVSILRPGRIKRSWLSLSAAPIRDADGRLLGAVMTMSDVTPLREAQARLQGANRGLQAQAVELVKQRERLQSLASELEKERARLHAIIDSAPEGIMVVDEQARVVMVNPAAARVYSVPGLTGDNRTELPPLMRTDGTPYSDLERPIAQSVQDGLTHRSVPGLVVSADGKRHDLLINTAPIVGTDGKCVGAVSVLQDVTELRRHERQRQELLERVQLSEEQTRRANDRLRQEVTDRVEAERQVRESRLLLERTVSSLRDAIFSLDVNDNIIHVNPAALQQFGYEREELLGRPMRILHVDQQSYHRLLLEREAAVGRRGLVALDQFPMRRKNAAVFPTELLEAPLEDESGAVLGRVCSVRDVSERLKLERMKAEFVASVSHELRSPLAAVMGYTEIVLSEGAGPLTELQQEFLQAVQESSRRLEWLINDLLDVSRMETGRYTLEIQPLAPGRLLQSAADNVLHAAAERGVDLRVGLPDFLPEMEGDARRLRQVLDNLLGNALKFTHRGGHVVVRAWARDQDLVIEVRDDGIGIPEEDRERIFERFYRAGNVRTEDAGGTGLGLYIARGIVTAHGGSIELESTVGSGSTFRVRLPLRVRSHSE